MMELKSQMLVNNAYLSKHQHTHITLCDDVILEIIYNADQQTIFAVAATSRRIHTLILKWYNSLPIAKLSSIHNLFTGMIPKSIIRFENQKLNSVLISQDKIQTFLRGLRDTDFGCWSVIKDQLQFIGNHQVVRYAHAYTHVYTVFRCAMCRKLTDNALYHPWIHYKGEISGGSLITHPRDIIIETVLCCDRCAGEMDAYWRSTLIDYIKRNNITNAMITHHDHRDVGHCVYRLRNQEYNDNMVLNDAEVFARVIVESGVEEIERTVNV